MKHEPLNGTLSWWLAGQAETQGVDPSDARQLTPSKETIGWAKQFEAAAAQALDAFNRKHGIALDGYDLIANEEGAYSIFATLRGEGVGIWDGRWDHLYNQTQLRQLQAFLERELAYYADDTGTGVLNTSLDDDVFDQVEIG